MFERFILYKKKHFSFVTSWSVSFLIQKVRSCAEQPFTVYACAVRGQIRSRNFSLSRKGKRLLFVRQKHYTNGCSLLGICFSVFVVRLPNVFLHTNDMFAKLHGLLEKSAEKKTKKSCIISKNRPVFYGFVLTCQI